MEVGKKMSYSTSLLITNVETDICYLTLRFFQASSYQKLDHYKKNDLLILDSSSCDQKTFAKQRHAKSTEKFNTRRCEVMMKAPPLSIQNKYEKANI